MARARKFTLLAAVLFTLVVSTPQLLHLLRFGHLCGFGLHADVVVRHADYGIDGITKVYEGKLTNYGIIPAKVTVCDFVDDTMSHGSVIGYAVEKWDGSAARWESIVKIDQSTFCHPYPLGMVETHIVVKRLWPGQTFSTGEEATAARDAFAVGDTARFVILAGQGLAFPTPAFSIDEHSKSGVPYRVRH